MNPETIRSAASAVVVACVVIIVAMACHGVTDINAYLGTVGFLVMAAFVAATQPA